MPLFGREKPKSAGAAGETQRVADQADDVEFTEFLKERAAHLADLCRFAHESGHKAEFPCRDYVSHLNHEAAQIEELVDGHGGQKNEKWFPFRESVAAAKLFAFVTHEVLHIRTAISRYDLIGAEEELHDETHRVVELMREALINATATILDQLKRCDLIDDANGSSFKPCTTDTMSLYLPSNRSVRHSEKVGETVVFLATQFLNLSEDLDVREVLKERDADTYAHAIPEPISEERLRLVESRFHNLQSLYDTYIFESDIEQQNRSLPTLRGHVSLIFHLMVVATNLAHYFIRHMSSLRRETFLQLRFPMTAEVLRSLIFEYPLQYARRYLEAATTLCQSMIREYSEETTVEVPIPNYRGFHVRPSTLIAKIVRHYGSPVTMKLGDQEYDAALPFDLFRANETINAVKRRRVTNMLDKDPELHVPIPADSEECTRELQLLFVRLMKEGSIVLYDTDLSFSDIEIEEGGTLAELASRYIVHLMSVGKLDVHSDITVTFVGDSRALNDLEVLANNGYGEDDIGNNIVLPKELAYLSR
ncbi:MAG: hypothetical protein ACOCYC_01290 [bacterium]